MSRVAIPVVCSLGLLLSMGCGSSQSAPTTVAASSASLKGNWLIAGSLPTFAANGTFSLATTIDVVNGQVVADIDEFFPCTYGGAGVAGGAATATIEPDGSFTLQPSLVNGVAATLTYTIHGQVPQTATGAWSGTYTSTNTNAGCSPMSGTFTATPIAPATGTFAGAGSISPPNSNLAVPVTITVTLQQGGPASLDDTALTRPVNSVNALSGSIKISGTSCFSSGTTSGVSGDVLGGDIGVSFTMDDGSKLELSADIADAATSTIQVRSVLVQGGNCDRWFGASRVKLLRQ